MKTIVEEKRETPVVAEVDVVVAGGGPAGIAAAAAAARINADVLLVERYGYLGGLATGGLVICLVETDRYRYGICKEVLDRLFELKAAELNNVGGETRRWVEGASFSGEESYNFDPEVLKFVANNLVTESGAKMLLHSLVVGSIVKERRVQGIIIEGKSGRQAVLGKVTVDATGDADVASASGAPYNLYRHPWGINLEFRLGDVDVEKATRWRKENPELYSKLMEKLEKETGKIGWRKTVNKRVVWCNAPHFYDVDGLNTWHLTRVEV